jgi:hypothetical protein
MLSSLQATMESMKLTGTADWVMPLTHRIVFATKP